VKSHSEGGLVIGDRITIQSLVGVIEGLAAGRDPPAAGRGITGARHRRRAVLDLKDMAPICARRGGTAVSALGSTATSPKRNTATRSRGRSAKRRGYFF